MNDKASSLMGDALLERLPIHQLFNLADRCKTGEQKLALADLYKRWIAFHPQDPFLYAAYFNYGTTLSATGDQFGAINAFRECTRLKPDFHQGHLSLGLVLERVGRAGTAVSQWLEVTGRLSPVEPDSVHFKRVAFEQIGRVLETLDRDEPAEDALRQRLELGLNDKVIQHWIALRMRQCKWPVLVDSERLKRRDLLAGISPLSLASFADDPIFQLATAFDYNKKLIGVVRGGVRRSGGEPRRARSSGRLRIGYVSSDFREHAVGFSMADVLETHNRGRFEVYAYYCGIDRDDPTKQRIKFAVDRWLDINPLSDEQAAAQIEADGIDILVDLNGYTKDARTRVFALRPAPIAVNWFGFPCTMGSPYHHYIVADAHVIPEAMEQYYSETVVRLPCYQANDRRRVVSDKPVSRADEGLPDNAFVYCCLNGLQKLTQTTFDRWMAILRQVPHGVLWLLGGTPDTQARLRARAAQSGIEAERLIFAQKKLNPEHVARYALADLFLDNLPYGAHTTAADALWMGVPVLTLPGRSFASRVCSSLVSAAGLDELICATSDDYVAQAVEFGLDRRRMASVKERLVAGRDTCLLFDTPRLVAELETAYRGMWGNYQDGRLPRPDLRNLDLYHEIGLTLEVEASEGLNDDDYRALYAARIAEWDATYPVRPDDRLWPQNGSASA